MLKTDRRTRCIPYSPPSLWWGINNIRDLNIFGLFYRDSPILSTLKTQNTLFVLFLLWNVQYFKMTNLFLSNHCLSNNVFRTHCILSILKNTVSWRMDNIVIISVDKQMIFSATNLEKSFIKKTSNSPFQTSLAQAL